LETGIDQGEFNIGQHYLGSLGAEIAGMEFFKHEKSLFHPYINRSSDCTCNFLDDPIVRLIQCPGNITKVNTGFNLGLAVDAYFLVGGNISISFDVIKFISHPFRRSSMQIANKPGIK
jgi:hypothetical protein